MPVADMRFRWSVIPTSLVAASMLFVAPLARSADNEPAAEAKRRPSPRLPKRRR